MPIELPDLDDRAFADLVEEGRRLIPVFAPAWTDHNASDPGITFVELFASVAEMLMFRLNRVSAANKLAFVKLLDKDWQPTAEWTADQELSAAVRRLRVEERAVTLQDYTRLALQASPGVARAFCLPRRNLDSSAADRATAQALGHVSVIVLVHPGHAPAAVLATVTAFLQSRVLIATRLHVVQPARLNVAVRLTVIIRSDQREETVRQRILTSLESFFDPIAGGRDGTGWPLGAPIYRADVYALVDAVEGVDYVSLTATDDVIVTGPAGAGNRKLPLGATTGYVGLRLEPNELVTFERASSTLTITRPQGSGGTSI